MTSKTTAKYPELVLMVVRRQRGLDPEDQTLDKEIEALPRRDIANEALLLFIGRSLALIERVIEDCGGKVIWPEE